MKILHCPLNGPRNIQEFTYGGEVAPMPDREHGSDADWMDYVFLVANARGPVREWWMHNATGYWFIAERDTATDEILRTYPAADLFGRDGKFVEPESDR